MKWTTLRRMLKGLTLFFASHLPARLYTGYDALYTLYERRGWHITPVHFYQPIPDSRELSDDKWSKRSSMAGIVMNEPHQLELLQQFQSKYKEEYDSFRDRIPEAGRFHFGQTSFCSVDAEILYCMVRKFKPKRMIETGCGMSTLLSAEAIRKNENEGNPCRFIAIDPYPEPFLRLGVPCLTELLTSRVESVPLERFSSLEENDILFIDSSHVSRIGGDVNYLYLEVIPRLKPGVIVHCHDIFLPAEYPKEWILEKRWFWTEQYLLQAFLAFNSEFQVLVANSFLHMNYSERLKAAFASYNENTTRPGSFWFRRIV